LFNAVRFALLNVAPGAAPAPRPTALEDRWILSRLRAAKADFAAQVDGFDFAKAALGLYDFVYGELCDWYLEFTKGRDFDEDLSATVLHVAEETLKLAHPIMPFVTEELWEMVPRDSSHPPLLAAARIEPEADALADPDAEAQVSRVIAVVTALRRWRDEAGVRRGAVLAVRESAAREPRSDHLFGPPRSLIARLARVEFVDSEDPPVATVTADGVALDVLQSDEVDTGAAERRVAAQRATLGREIARAEGRLANAGFVAKAPPAVVDAERDKLARLRVELAAL
nr:class I tRNA ligase family protein [Solirubrobacterales bacterium]